MSDELATPASAGALSRVTGSVICPTCEGSGEFSGRARCPACKGTGRQLKPLTRLCPNCGGWSVVGKACGACRGSGVMAPHEPPAAAPPLMALGATAMSAAALLTQGAPELAFLPFAALVAWVSTASIGLWRYRVTRKEALEARALKAADEARQQLAG